jgi:hypothetical protein
VDGIERLLPLQHITQSIASTQLRAEARRGHKATGGRLTVGSGVKCSAGHGVLLGTSAWTGIGGSRVTAVTMGSSSSSCSINRNVCSPPPLQSPTALDGRLGHS